MIYYKHKENTVKYKKDGFSVVEIIIVIVIVALIGVLGVIAYKGLNNKDSSDKAADSSKQDTEKTKPDTTTGATAFVNVIQDDSSITQLAPDKIAATADQQAILTALHNTCASSDTYVTVNHAVFDGTDNFMQEGNYAEINASACSPLAKNLSDLSGSGFANFLHKDNAGTWVLDTSSQDSPSCSKVDGLGYPTSIIATCYDGSTSRAPR